MAKEEAESWLDRLISQNSRVEPKQNITLHLICENPPDVARHASKGGGNCRSFLDFGGNCWVNCLIRRPLFPLDSQLNRHILPDMPSDDAPIIHAEKLKALRQIESALRRSKHPTLRACGLTEAIAATVANEHLIELYIIADDASDLDRYAVNKIAASGQGILAQGDVADLPPLKVSVLKHQESVWLKICRGLGKGLWELVKIGVGVVLGWYLAKHFGK